MILQRSQEVVGDIDDLLDWFREVETQLQEAEQPSHDPEIVRVQLKEHKKLQEDISIQKGRVRDTLGNAKKVSVNNTSNEYSRHIACLLFLYNLNVQLTSTNRICYCMLISSIVDS